MTDKQHTPCLVGQRRLRRQLTHELQEVRLLYKAALKQGGFSPTGEWLTDNFYLLEREGRLAARELRHIKPLPGDKKEGFCALYRMCEAFTEQEKLTEDALKQLLSGEAEKRPLESRELDALPVLLRAALYHRAAGIFLTPGPEEERASRLGEPIGFLRAIEGIDFFHLTEVFSETEQLLREDPAGVYPHMDERSRALYRRVLSREAARKHLTETQAARRVLLRAKAGTDERSRHVGAYILQQGRPMHRRRRRGQITLIVQAVLPLVPAILAAWWGRTWYLLPVLYFPLWEILSPLIRWAAAKGVPPAVIPRMEHSGVIPEEGRTVVVISTLLSSPDRAGSLYGRLEQLYHSNGQGAVTFCVLADLKEAKSPELPQDEAAVLAAMRAIRTLNRKYGERFVLAVRPRRYSRTQRAFSGWERKRGAIAQLCRMIKGGEVEWHAFEGDREFLCRSRYLLALDADTELLMDTASELAACALHPLNRPVIDREAGCVTEGYGILTPRMATTLSSAEQTAFSRLMEGLGGVTVYDTVSGDFYQDLFGRSIFAGKGLIDIEAFDTLLTDVFPEGTVLSHDILEGGVLRAGLVSDVEMADGCPSGVGDWMMRLHRWIRGDWQNIGWIRKGKKTAKGRQNPLPGLARWQLTDNLRRSMMPVLSLFCLHLSLFHGGVAGVLLSIAGVWSVMAGGLFSALLSLVNGGISMLSRRYYSKAMPQAMQAVLQACMALCMLPRHAQTAFDAAVRALWRLYVSKKGLLSWVTFADTRCDGPVGLLKNCWYAVLNGAALLVFAQNGLAKLAGLFFLALVPVACFTAKPAPKNRFCLTPSDREKLLSYCAAMWRFYEESCTAAEHDLPPDNVQESPVPMTAHRTSPTNIGFYLLSVLSARDCGLIDSDTLAERVENTLKTVERLEKWEGNLYNWYDTRTARPLTPVYVSAVDSGNFACCLTALAQGLLEYAGECSSLSGIAQRVQALADQTNLAVFYSARRRLMHIGFDVKKGEMTGSFYDLLMSEARMASYFAIAKRQVPKKHWGALGRTLATMGGYAGPVSWTGTMFEFFMPAILLPAAEGSMGYEALRFAAYCQRRRVRKAKTPWGISESGFYAFDAQLAYQYKAHGVQKLGLKRGLNSQLVVSPYSTFLTLPFTPAAALHNLRELERLGLTGRFGFYEAADFTKHRTAGAPFAPVKSYMAHHVGMSMTSACNLLFHNIFQQRFMRSPDMAAARELLQEKIPSGAPVFRDVEERDMPQKPGRQSSDIESYQSPGPTEVHMHLLTNGEWTEALTDCGTGFIRCRSVDVTRRSSDLLSDPQGVYAVVQGEGDAFSVTAAPDYRDDIERRCEFAGSYAAYYAKHGGLEAGLRMMVHPAQSGCQRQLVLKNHTAFPMKATALFYLEPSLAKTDDAAAHPAFSRIFMESSYDSGTGVLLFSRRPRGSERTLHLAAGLLEAIPFEYECGRERLLQRPYGIRSLTGALSRAFEKKSGVPDTACCIRTQVTLPPKGQKTVTLLLYAASGGPAAIGAVVNAREEGMLTTRTAAPSPLSGGGMESRIAQALLPRLFYPVWDGAERLDAIRHNRMGAAGLWGMGISGDLPIVLLTADGTEEPARLDAYLSLHGILRKSGIVFDLAILYQEGGDYACPVKSAVMDAVKRAEAEHLTGQKGGVHLIDRVRHSEEAVRLLIAAACHIAPRELIRPELPAPSFTPLRIAPVMPADRGKGGLSVLNGRFEEDCFVVTGKPSLPWCHILANPAFGTMVSDCALGFTWAVNSRENKLTPWFNDSRRDNTGERLLLKIDGEVFDCLQGASARFSPSKAEWLGKAGDVEVTVTVTVPEKGTQKEVLVEMTNTGEEKLVHCAFYTEPVLGVNRSTAQHISAKWDGKSLTMRNPMNSAVPGMMSLWAEGGTAKAVCDRTAFLSGRWDEHRLAPLADCCAALVVPKRLPPKRREQVRFVLAWAAHEKAFPALQKKGTPPQSRQPACSIRVHTPYPALDVMVNTFLPHQVKAARLNGRTGFYQCGGAWGFRDQLQDCATLMQLEPLTARRHLIRAAAHQFEEGDVMHWWHTLPKTGGGERGVRTRYSDDLLWLPFVLCRYLGVTGDWSVLSVPVRYLSAPELSPEEHDRYFEPSHTDYQETLYQHAVRAVERARRFGEHGLPLMGGGDWNDGYNLVGEQGKGESVWLAMFLSMVEREMAVVCDKQEDRVRAEEYRQEAERLKGLIDRNAWDGDWYLRAFYDDGSEMGSHKHSECRLDSLSQSFAVLCGLPDDARIQSALDWCMRLLVDEKAGIVRLFYPPFDKAVKNPGYVKGYPAGLRENGGQYTHAACWLAMAMLRARRAEDGWKLIRLLNPAEKCLDPDRAARCQTEPYAVAGDVYAHRDAMGRGGWSHYTGAAGWLYQVIVEELLGIRIRDGKLTVQPCLPKGFGSFTAQVTMDGRTYQVSEQGVEKVEHEQKMH